VGVLVVSFFAICMLSSGVYFIGGLVIYFCAVRMR
jgi:hypothetical protein